MGYSTRATEALRATGGPASLIPVWACSERHVARLWPCLLLIELCSAVDDETDECFLGQRALVRRIGAPYRSEVSRSIEVLVELGLVRTKPSPGMTTRYVVDWHGWPPLPPLPPDSWGR